MNTIATFLRSSLGKKYLMAITGAGLFLFVIGHMLGNLQIFLGQETLNAYGAFLKSKPAMLWGARLGLLALVLVHIWAAVTIARENRAARPRGYAHQRWVAASYASRTMIWSGLIIAAFIVYHLLHFTVFVTDPGFAELRDPAGRHDVYGMVILGFSNPLVSAFYIVAVGLLCLHLSHGISSMFQSVGWKNAKYQGLVQSFAAITAWVIFLGNISIPVAVLLGLVK